MSSYKSWLEKQKKKINKTYDAQKKTVEDEYKNAVNDTSSAYESEYRQNEVDRIFNEKKIAEINANLGLTNSGLNRTQQTAVQLSHSNRDYEISKARQDNIDDLALEKAKAITEINLNRQNAIAEAEDQAESMKAAAAKAAAAAAKKAEQEEKEKISATAFMGTIRTPSEFGRGTNPDLTKYKTYKNYVKGMLEKYANYLTDEAIIEIINRYDLTTE